MFGTALYRIWKGLEYYDPKQNMSQKSQSRSKCTLTLHLIFLFIYLGFQIYTLVNFQNSVKKIDNDILIDISWISWMVSILVNSLIMLIVMGKLNKHYKEVIKNLDDSETILS